MKTIKIVNDDFGVRCRMKTKSGKRCRRKARWLVNDIVISRQSWLDALKTGWPRIVRGMKEPIYHKVGFCHMHGCTYDRRGPNYIFGVGLIKPVSSVEDFLKNPKEDYLEAKKLGDQAVTSQGYDV